MVIASFWHLFLTMRKYRVLETTEKLKEGDILVQSDTIPFLFCTKDVCTTEQTIENNPDKFEEIT